MCGRFEADRLYVSSGGRITHNPCVGLLGKRIEIGTNITTGLETRNDPEDDRRNRRSDGTKEIDLRTIGVEQRVFPNCVPRSLWDSAIVIPGGTAGFCHRRYRRFYEQKMQQLHRHVQICLVVRLRRFVRRALITSV